MTEQRDPGTPGRGRDPRGEGQFKMGTSAGRYAGVGLQFAAIILVFLFLGQWLDRRLGTGWITVVAVLVGATAAMYGMYRSLMADLRREEDARRREREERERR
ncbi:MAG TPA: AtpZ/AtpI family protein, partial [Gemmatimonadaceae bacterium]|nr:AtpZ/AtpI family protein [Gemmatimonadaceae bacterium]